MKIVWSPRAIRHLIAVRAFIAKDNPAAANSVGQQIVSSVEQLAKHPSMGRPGRVAGTRELIIPGTPYLIPYRGDAEKLQIIAVFHGRQRWPDSL